MSDPKQEEQKINIELDEATAEGTYSNLAIINHSISEFIVDFISMMPGSPKAKVKSRIILTPQHAKRLQKALSENIQRFEQANGEIQFQEQPPIPLNFGPTGEA
ncbi:DUF3467 domain-containing protein [Flavobacteriaceae bacterium]|nr:DUF3467 domain-containing protein [Flavobacteriaceae bacterium]